MFDAWLIRYRNDSISRDFGTVNANHPRLVAFLTGYTLAHLYGVLPSRADAFASASRLVAK